MNRSDPPLPRIALGVLRTLNRLLPAELRRGFAGEIERDQRRMLLERGRRGGRRAVLAGMLKASWDVLRQAMPPRRPFRSGHRGAGRSRKGSKSMWFGLMQDSRLALRSLGRSPTMTLLCLLTLGPVLGAGAALFSLIDAALLSPLPYPQSDRLVALWDTDQDGDKFRVSPFNYLRWREEGRAIFEEMGLSAYATAAVTTPEGPIRLFGSQVDSGFFEVLGVNAALGRTLIDEDFEPQSQNAVVLNRSAWRVLFGDSEEFSGRRELRLDDEVFSVVGVLQDEWMPLQAWASGAVEFGRSRPWYWRPLREIPDRRGSHVYGVLARLRPGLDVETAAGRMQAVTAAIEQRFPGSQSEHGVRVVPLHEELTGKVDQPLKLLAAGVALVWLIACANVAGLMLLRATSRRREWALRSALGAGRFQIVRRLAIEGGFLAVASSVLALFAAGVLLRLSSVWDPGGIPRLDQALLNGRSWGLVGLLCLVTFSIFAALPAILVSGRNRLAHLSRASRRGRDSGSPVFRKRLVTVQVALALILVIGAGLLLRSVHRLNSVAPGFRSENVLGLDLMLLFSRYPAIEQRKDFVRRYIQELESLPGVASAAVAYDHPLESNWIDSFRLQAAPDVLSDERLAALFRTVSPGYFRTLGIRVVEGRPLIAADDNSPQGVVVVNQSFAHKYFGDRSPLEQRIYLYRWQEKLWQPHRIVGVVQDVKFAGPAGGSSPAYYLPYGQRPHFSMTVFLRTYDRPEDLRGPALQRLKTIDPQQPVSRTWTLQDLLAETKTSTRFSAGLLSAFALTALLLALLGVWGVLGETVRRRSHEIGIRMALGADRREVFRLMVLQGLQPVGLGVVLGLLGAVALSRLLSGLLFEVSATDAMTYSAVSAILLLSAFLCCLFPARQASRTEPMRILRED